MTLIFNMKDIPQCRVCRSRRAQFKGHLQDGTEFAGKAVSEPIPGGGLWRCRDCLFVFRYPILAMDRYDELYRNGREDVWSIPKADRQDFNLIVGLLSKRQNMADILDVGCYDGQLLLSLPNNYRLHGVEINQRAMGIATERGISIVASSIDNLTDVVQRFDVITACDVIEHVENPLVFLSQLKSLLKPGGKIIVSTGNADAWLWRIMGSLFWYCYFPEHISFVGRRWLKNMPSRIGLRADEILAFNYAYDSSWSRGALRTLKRTFKFAYRNSNKSPGDSASSTPPGCGATADHVIGVLTAE
jgi:SAM-dependent methyltransferase